LLISAAGGPTTAAVSTFDLTTENWGVANDAQNFTHNLNGGNPGGYVSAVDIGTGATWYFEAPSRFLGDQSVAFGSNLTFDLRQSQTSSQFNDEDVILKGETFDLVFDTANNPASANWTRYAVPLLTSADWRRGNLNGPAATEQELRQVLGNLQGLWIRGEYRIGSDTGSLDNVALVPEPASLALLGVGGLVLAGRRRRASSPD
jgi:hypothetical protein